MLLHRTRINCGREKKTPRVRQALTRYPRHIFVNIRSRAQGELYGRGWRAPCARKKESKLRRHLCPSNIATLHKACSRTAAHFEIGNGWFRPNELITTTTMQNAQSSGNTTAVISLHFLPCPPRVRPLAHTAGAAVRGLTRRGST